MASIPVAVAQLTTARQERKAQASVADTAARKSVELEEMAKAAELEAQLEAEEKTRKLQAGQTQTTLTTPLGVTDTAPTKKPILLGVG